MRDTRRNISIHFIITMLLFSLVFSENAKHTIFNSVRIAYCNDAEAMGRGEWNQFLARAKNARYNYILAEFAFHRGDKSIDSGTVFEKKRDFIRAFTRIDSFGMRMIPMIQIGSVWSASDECNWKYAKTHWNQKIQLNSVKGSNSTGAPFKEWGMTALAPDSSGVDSTYADLLRTIRQSHSESRVSYPIEYIHIGHDEPTFFEICLIGGVLEGELVTSTGSPDGWKILSEGRMYAQVDRDYISKRMMNGEDISTAIVHLMVNEVFRRIEQTHRILGTSVSVMIMADMWDPQQNGATSFITYLSKRIKNNPQSWTNTLKTTPLIAHLPGLDESQKKVFKNSLILMPWYYERDFYARMTHEGRTRRWTYNPETTFRYITSHGFTFIYIHEIISDHDGRTRFTTSGYPQHRIDQANNYFKAALKFKSHCLGYNASAFCGWSTPPSRSFETLEYLYLLNSKHINSVDNPKKK